MKNYFLIIVLLVAALSLFDDAAAQLRILPGGDTTTTAAAPDTIRFTAVGDYEDIYVWMKGLDNDSASTCQFWATTKEGHRVQIGGVDMGGSSMVTIVTSASVTQGTTKLYKLSADWIYDLEIIETGPVGPTIIGAYATSRRE